MRKKILFCGTPAFSVASLQSIIKYQNELKYDIIGVITIPDKIAGRGKKMKESAIKIEAKKEKLEIFEPIDLSDQDFIHKIKQLKLDLIIVVAFRKLPKVLFEIPKIGTINLHASLLPKYRGAAPINWAIINNEKKTGLTTFFINDTIDTGDIILQTSVNISKDWHANDLYDALIIQSDKLIKRTIQKVFQKKYELSKQHELKDVKLKYAPKINKKDLVLNKQDWHNKKLQDIYNLIRGMSPPGLKTELIIENENSEFIKKNIIITRVDKFKKQECFSEITSIQVDRFKNKIIIAKHNEQFVIKKLKLENSKELTDKEFINGFLKKKNYINKIYIK